MDQNNVIDRLKKFILANPQVAKSGLIKGLDSSTGKIVIVENGIEKRITIEELENGYLTATPKEQTINNDEQIEVMEDEKEEVLETLDTPVNDEKKIVTLKDMSDAIARKDEKSINKALETFAINQKTGSIDIYKAIKVVTDNSTNNVVECVKNGDTLPSDLSCYDIKGSLIVPAQKGNMPLEKLEDISFNSILVYVAAAKLRNINLSESNILSAKNKYEIGINDRLNVLGLNKKEEPKVEAKENENEKTLSMQLKPDKNLKKAGFADIFILTIIVTIYAAIIINLISKLK